MISTVPPVAPVTVSCLVAASKAYHVPLTILSGVIAQEGGKTGKTSKNKNGTIDYGPMQINTVMLSGLAKQGITPYAVANNGCLNIYIGAAILKQHADKSHGNWWLAAGKYHSKTPKHRDSYLLKVAQKVQKLIKGEITIASILADANG